MAFPSVAAATSSVTGSNSATLTVDLPTGVSSGDLLIVGVGVSAGTTLTFPAGWTEIVDDVQSGRGRSTLAVAYRQADGTEGSSITVTSGESIRGGHYAYRITGHEDPSAQAPEANTNTTSATTSHDCPSLTPTGGAKDYLWLVFGATNDNNINGFPSNYTSTGTTNTDFVDLGWGQRDLNASSEDPGAFTTGSNEDLTTATIAVHPTSGGGGANESDSAVITSATASTLQSADSTASTDNATLTAAVASVIASTDTSSATDSAQTTSVTAAVLQGSATAIASDAAAIITASAAPLTSTETTDSATNAADNAVITQVGAATLTASESATAADTGAITASSVTIQTSAETASTLDNALIVNAQGQPLASVESVQTDANITTVTVTPLTASETTGTAEILLGTPEITAMLSAEPNTVPVLQASPEVVAKLKANLTVTPE